jgi:hypothetical protein
MRSRKMSAPHWPTCALSAYIGGGHDSATCVQIGSAQGAFNDSLVEVLVLNVQEAPLLPPRSRVAFFEPTSERLVAGVS